MLSALADLTDALVPEEAERVQAAALLVARGDLRRLDEAMTLGRADRRDLLVAAGLADENWPDRMETEPLPALAGHIWMARQRRRSG
ncbi:hypothetical protein [Actinomadura macrotermitis]|uniref:hypothetical protein n=1 Tax=Actinomadura macrotermitis TaxID=2585200 RepID=UPI00129507D3|nr:hypothetical protein [Actinomadura macrotermitis]